MKDYNRLSELLRRAEICTRKPHSMVDESRAAFGILREEFPELFSTPETATSNGLSNSDEWFCNNLICIIELQKYLVNKGKQESIDKTHIQDFVNKYTV